MTSNTDLATVGFESLRDTALGEAVRGDDGGISTSRVAFVVDAYRKGQIFLDEHSAFLIDTTDQVADMTKGWGEYAKVLGGVAYMDAFIETIKVGEHDGR